MRFLRQHQMRKMKTMKTPPVVLVVEGLRRTDVCVGHSPLRLFVR